MEEEKKKDGTLKHRAALAQILVEFEEMKRKSQSGETLEFLRSQMRFNVGDHRKTRLKRVGAANSRSLLHEEVGERHALILQEEYSKRVDRIGKDAQKRLKWVTILQEVVDANVEDVSWAVERLENQFKGIVSDMGLWSRGALELEMVNIEILEKIAGRNDEEQRKLDTLTGMWDKEDYQGMKIFGNKSVSKVLVHAHVVVDLGADFVRNGKLLADKFDKVNSWNRAKRQVLIKSFMKHKAVEENIEQLAHYATKGGNVNKHGRIEYKTKFGTDLADTLERQMLKSKKGLSGDERKKSRRADKGGDTIEDERGLTVGDLAKLDELIVWLMKRRKDKRGYLVCTVGRR